MYAVKLMLLVSQIITAQVGQPAVKNTRMIKVEFNNATIRSAVQSIIEKSGIEVLYSPASLPNQKVTYHGMNVHAEDALVRVLNGTGISIERLSDGSLKLVPGAVSVRANGVITGRVTDGRTAKGVSGATVSIGGDARSVTSMEDGAYKFAGVVPGIHTISVRLVGYAKQSRSVTVGDGATVTADFKLEPSANVLDQVIVTGTVVQTELKAVPNAITVVTAKQIEEQGITRIDQLFRGDVPGLFSENFGTVFVSPGFVKMSSRGATTFDDALSQPIKVYVDGVELLNSSYMGLIDPSSIERIEILTGPQASTIYGSNAINGVMQIFTKRGTSIKPKLNATIQSGVVQNDINTSLAPRHNATASLSGTEGRWSYNVGGAWDYTGSWTPAINNTRLSASGGIRMQQNHIVADASLSRGTGKNFQDGSPTSFTTDQTANGALIYSFTSGLRLKWVTTNTSETGAISLSYTPVPWWSQTVNVGANKLDLLQVKSGFVNFAPSDTLLSIGQSNNSKQSLSTNGTLQLPVSSFGNITFTVGADNWKSSGLSLDARPTSLIGALNTIDGLTRRTGHNAGGFLQGQLGIHDALFFTYGLRAEWNPTYGENAQPNLAPRYGVAYTHTIDNLTAKIRASYGRSTRPASEDLTRATAATPNLVALYGPFDQILANPNLLPELQRGGEGGIELYFGGRSSIVVTRYNQTVNDLIYSAKTDSVVGLTTLSSQGFECRSYWPNCTFYYLQSQNVNLGSIRNIGWEGQGTLNFGPFTAKGTYSFTKSRIIGITPKYRNQFPQYVPGATFAYAPEHTWATNLSYSNKATTISLNVNGIGLLYRTSDDMSRMVNANTRFSNYKPRLTLPSIYRSLGTGYATANLNASHRFSRTVEGNLRVYNLTDYYRNDRDAVYASPGRETRVGLRLNW